MSETKPIILIGAGGHCQSVIEAAESAGMNIKGILDKPHRVGESVFGYPILGTDADIPTYVDDNLFVVALGAIKDPSRRIQLHRSIFNANGQLATIIASTATISPHAIVHPGAVIMHRAVVNAGAIIGVGAIINTGAIIEHNATIGDFSHISTAAVVNGDCRIGESVFIGSNATICNNVIVHADAVVGAGAVVTGDLSYATTYAGVPARPLRPI